VRARVIPANVHDSILMLVNGNCELMFAYHHPELPLHLDPKRHEYLTVGADTFMPVCKHDHRSAPAFRLPGTNDRPLPLISYTETSYFGRCLAVLLGMRTRLLPCGFITNQTSRKCSRSSFLKARESRGCREVPSLPSSMPAIWCRPERQCGSSKSSFGFTGMRRITADF
jgi:hypothetical protein